MTMGFMALLPVILQLLPMLLSLISTAETAFSGRPGESGAAKKKLVLDGLKVGLDAAATMGAPGLQDPAKRDEIHKAAGGLVDGIVDTLNAAGWAETAGGPSEH
jgi:hypothetical protein